MTQLEGQSQASPIWLIFDICTVPDYYADPLNILALPKGWVYVYDYAETQFSVPALELARATSNQSSTQQTPQ